MTLWQARALFEYWKGHPPEHEAAAIMLRAQTTWEPEGPPLTEEQSIAAHRKSLEQRWRAGAMNPKQLLDLMGGSAPVAFGANGIVQTPQMLPGSVPPGAPK